ncbi:MAG TPA: hypothetical protein VEB18_02485 [Candidatus Paceibacterota bacterium]|nr:hypothetical protein [Candidatus Paceibacterota bacterium]
MARLLLIALSLGLLPIFSYAATLQADESVAVSVSPADNAYLFGADVQVSAPLPADLLALAGELVVAAPVAGDALLGGGSVSVSAPVDGDIRALGGRLSLAANAGGDIAALGGTISITGAAEEVQAAGGRVEVTGGARGPVTVYGGVVSLGGTFDGNVRVVASDRVTLIEGTVINGTFEYNAPQEAAIPASATIAGGARYIGSSSFLPSAEEARTFALAGVGVLFLVRVVAGVLAAGLLVGLFPKLATMIVEPTLGTLNEFMRRFLIGFGALVLTPILVILLLASFVGIGIAAVVGAAYLLLLLLSYLYAAALLGALLLKVAGRSLRASWKSTIAGVVLLYLLGLVPGFGFFIAFLLLSAALGALLSVGYTAAFSNRS